MGFPSQVQSLVSSFPFAFRQVNRARLASVLLHSCVESHLYTPGRRSRPKEACCLENPAAQRSFARTQICSCGARSCQGIANVCVCIDSRSAGMDPPEMARLEPLGEPTTFLFDGALVTVVESR